MKITVCSLYINDWYREIVKYGKKTMEQYCSINNYDFYYETEETQNTIYDGKREEPWYKVKLILKLLEESDCDYIVWNDADTQVINFNIKMEDIINEYIDGKDLLVAKDFNSTLNTGTMFIKNCEYNKLLFQSVWDNDSNFDKSLHEQASLCDIYEKNILNSKDHIKVLPHYLQNVFLTYWYSYLPYNCFIFHATRCSYDVLGFIFTMDYYCPIKMEEEQNEHYEDRKNRLFSQEVIDDIEHFRNGGGRRNTSIRYLVEMIDRKIQNMKDKK